VPAARVGGPELRRNRGGVRSERGSGTRTAETGARGIARSARDGTRGGASRHCQHARPVERRRRPMTDRFDIVAAFADGESVAAADLSTALAHEDARAYLIDVLALRGLATGAAPVTRASSGSSISVARRGWSALSLVAAAALVIVGVAIGRNTSQAALPAPQDGAATVNHTAGPAAPAPTHVIRIENGVTWNERAGGN